MRANHEHCRESNERSEIDQHKGDRKSGLDQEILKIMLWKIGWICMSCMPDVPFEKEGISSKLDKVSETHHKWKTYKVSLQHGTYQNLHNTKCPMDRT